MDDGLKYNIVAAPLYFVRNGYTNIGSGTLINAGGYGDCWSSVYRGSTGNTVYALRVLSTGVSPSLYSASYRYYGRSVRCLAY